MRRTLVVAAAFAASVVLFSGCGVKVKGVSGTVATVDGKSISSQEYFDTLHRRYGKDMLTGLMQNALLEKWAEDEKAPVTDKQVAVQVEILKRNGVYNDQVKQVGEDAINREMRAVQARINIAKKLEPVTKEELSKAYENMKPGFVHGPRVQVEVLVNPDETKVNDAKAALDKGRDFDEVAAEFGTNPMGGSSTIKIWVDLEKPGLPKNIVDAAKDLKVGKYTDVLGIGPKGKTTQFLIMKAIDKQKSADLKLAQVKDEVESNVAVAKFQQTMTEKLRDKMKEAKVDIKVDSLKDVKYRFMYPPEPQMGMGGAPQ